MKFEAYQYIWKSFLEGDQKAFADLYKIYAEDLFMYGFKITSEEVLIKDAIQELFIEIWKNKDKLSKVEKPKAYLLKALHYKLLRSLKKESKIIPLNPEVIEKVTATAAFETTWILEEMKTERIEILRNHLNNLPERQRQILHLKYFQNLTSKQIGDLLNINTQSVSNLLYRGISTLRKNILKKNKF